MKEKSYQYSTVWIAIGSLFSVIILWKYTIILFVVLLIFALLLLMMKKSQYELKTFLFCWFFGAICEGIVIYFSNAWQYSQPDILGILPWRLILLWGIAGVFMGRVYTFLKEK